MDNMIWIMYLTLHWLSKKLDYVSNTALFKFKKQLIVMCYHVRMKCLHLQPTHSALDEYE